MKKLLALVLVLGMASIGMASVAGAALVVDIDVNGQDWDGVSSVEPSDIITVTWALDAIAYGGPAGIDYNVSMGDMVSFFSSSDGLVANLFEVVERGEGFAVVGSASGMPFPARDIFTFEFHVPDVPPSTIIEIDTLAGGFMGVVDGVAVPGPDDHWPYATIHVIPEPMTMALLGLGGLGLLRRRRA